MTRSKAEKEIHKLVPGAWVKQKKDGWIFYATLHTPGGGKWQECSTVSQADAFDKLVRQTQHRLAGGER
jgi:hypothetical protein